MPEMWVDNADKRDMSDRCCTRCHMLFMLLGVVDPRLCVVIFGICCWSQNMLLGVLLTC